MSRGEFGSPSYGTLSSGVRVNFDRPSSRYSEGKVGNDVTMTSILSIH